MKYEIRITQITPNGCCLVYAKDYETNEEIEEMTVYNKKLRCFMTKERKDNENKNWGTRINRKTRH